MIHGTLWKSTTKRNELMHIQDAPTYDEILADPSTHNYVKEVIRLVIDRDLVGVANDMDIVAKAAARRANCSFS